MDASTEQQQQPPPQQANLPPSPLAHPDMALWQQRVQAWYPRWRERAYFVPAVHMHHTRYTPVNVSGAGEVLVTDPPVDTMPAGQKIPKGSVPPLLDSDIRDDQAQQRVLRCFNQIAGESSDMGLGQKGEVMFVLSQLQYVDYLSEPSFASAAALLPTPASLATEAKNRQGDFDLLVLHRDYGVLVGEVKSVGAVVHASQSQQQQDQTVAKKMSLALKQLHKADAVLKHVLSDQRPPPRVALTLVLPNVTTERLQRVLATNPKVKEDLCRCVGVSSSEDPSPLCLTADGLANPAQWWRDRMTAAGPDPAMSDAVYLDLVSRFSGPATSVKVPTSSLPRLGRRLDLRTEGEFAAETGWRFMQLVLHPSQVRAVHTPGPLVHLTGPPGTGKSLVLLLKGLEWLALDHHVQILSTQFESMASCHMAMEQLQRKAGPAAAQRVHLHTFNLRDGTEQVQAAATSLIDASRAEGGELYVIVDEVFRAGCDFYAELVNDLKERVSTLNIWSASVRHGCRPKVMTEVVLTEPLRTPPAITREIQQCESMMPGGSVMPYTPAPSPLPADGLAPRAVLHHPAAHGVEGTVDCEVCGREVGRILKEELSVGTARADPSLPHLQYRDVFLLTFRANELLDDQTDDEGHVTQPATGLLRGVRDFGLPVSVLRRGDIVNVGDVARMTSADEIIASDSGTVSGLEREVVVFIQKSEMGTGSSEENYGRRDTIARCTAQLIWVRPA